MINLSDFVISSSATLLHAVEKIERNHCRAVIVAKNNVVIGILSEGDIMRLLLKGVDINLPVIEIVRSSFKFLHQYDRKAAFELCRKHLISLVPIVDDDFKLVDIITLNELIKSAELKENE